MKRRPETAKKLESHSQSCEVICDFLEKYWLGLKSIKPKGYDELKKDYTDYDGIDEWDNNERGKQEDDFKGFDNGDFNIVRALSAPHVVYDDLSQGRPPLRTLISAILAYGFEKGEIYGKEKGKTEGRHESIKQIKEFVDNLAGDSLINMLNKL